VVNIAGVTADPDVLVTDRAWVRSVWEQLRPLARNSGGYVNFMTEADDDRVQGAYCTKYDRLAGIKATYDPGNLVHRNANIKPI